LVAIETVVGIGSAIFAGIGLIFNALSHRNDTNSRNLQVVRDFASTIEELEDSKDRNSKNKKAFAVFAKKYLNLHDRIAYLAIKRAISRDLAMYFNYSFSAAIGILERDDFKDWKNEFDVYLLPWCKLQCINPDKDAIIPKC